MALLPKSDAEDAEPAPPLVPALAVLGFVADRDLVVDFRLLAESPDAAPHPNVQTSARSPDTQRVLVIAASLPRPIPTAHTRVHRSMRVMIVYRAAVAGDAP